MPLQLQMIPSEMLPLSKTKAWGSNPVRQGIEFDGIGRRIVYRFLRRHPGDVTDPGAAYETVRVPASEIIHVVDLSKLPGHDRQRRDYAACAWLPPNWICVDPLKDARAEIEQIDARLKSRTQALAERGNDAEQVDAEIAVDRAREKALDLAFAKPAPAAPASAMNRRSMRQRAAPAARTR